jgi:hypothetical protein
MPTAGASISSPVISIGAPDRARLRGDRVGLGGLTDDLGGLDTFVSIPQSLARLLRSCNYSGLFLEKSANRALMLYE